MSQCLNIYLKVSVVWALAIRMHACLLKAKKILEVGVQGLKLSIYTYLTYHSLHDNRKTTEKLFTQQGKN